MADISPTTTIGASRVPPFGTVVAHHHNNNGTRSFPAIGTTMTSLASQLEYVPRAGLRVQAYIFIANINSADFWNFANSTRKNPGGMIACAQFPLDDDLAGDLKAARLTARDRVEWAGTGANGSCFLITWSRGRRGR